MEEKTINRSFETQAQLNEHKEQVLSEAFLALRNADHFVLCTSKKADHSNYCNVFVFGDFEKLCTGLAKILISDPCRMVQFLATLQNELKYRNHE